MTLPSVIRDSREYQKTRITSMNLKFIVARIYREIMNIQKVEIAAESSDWSSENLVLTLNSKL